MKTSKCFLSTLIAAAAMTATVYAEIDSELGTLEWTTAPSTAADFYSGDYGLTFNFTEEVIKTLDADKSYVLAAYWGGSGTSSYGANALVLNYSSSSDTWTLQIGRGYLSDTDLTASTTFTFQDSVTFSQTISVDTAYTLSVTGGNQAMTPTLSWGDSSTETLSSYAGNMNGYAATMNYGLLNLYYITDSVWGGGETGNWSDASWTTGSNTNQSLGATANVTFNSSATMTATEAVAVNSITLAADQTLTLAGTGKVSSGDLNNSGTIAINSESTLSTTAATTLGTITGSGRLELGTGDATPGSNFTSETWTGTVAFVDATESNLSVSSYGNKNSTVAFNGFTGFFAEGLNGTIVSDIAVEGSLTINDGWSGKTLTFSGEVSGEGTFAFTKGNTQKFAFTNNVDLATMSFSGGSATFTGNTTSIDTLAVNNTTLDFSETNLTIGRLINNGTFTHSSGTLNLTGSGKGDNGSLNWGTFTIGASAAVNVSADMKISAWSGGNSSQKALVLEEGAKLSVDGDIYNASGVAITNAGGIVTKGTMHYASNNGWSTNTFSGDGYIVAERLSVYNQTQLVLQDHKFVFGALDFGGNGDARLGTATIGATKDWSSAKAMALTGATGTEETTTTFNTGAFDTSSGAFSSENGYTITLSGALSGVGAIVKEGAGTLTLSGDNTYTGGTTISQGTLVAAHANALGTGSVKVVSGATLQADTAITLSSDLTLAVSDADQTGSGLITGSGVTLDSSAKLLIDIGNLTSLASTDSVNSIALTLAASGALSASEDQIQLGTWSDTSTWTDYTGDWYVDSWSSDTGVLTLAIPEPSLFGLLAGLGALTLVGTRRRRAKKD